uniref:Uncharacterized protein n=1 Tax=Arundo donax TaxID=35708 RepID=A0A0A9FJA7_ARUDO
MCMQFNIAINDYQDNMSNESHTSNRKAIKVTMIKENERTRLIRSSKFFDMFRRPCITHRRSH